MDQVASQPDSLPQDIETVRGRINHFKQSLTTNKIRSDIAKRLDYLSNELDQEMSQTWFMDLHSILNPARFIETAQNTYRNYKRYSWLEVADIARNILILFPVMLTWLELATATSNYGRLVEQFPDMRYEPFLTLWQRGFPGLAARPGMSFSTLALVDTVLIALIILLSIGVHFLRDLLIEKKEKQILDLASELEEILWDLNKIFRRKRVSVAQTSEERANEVINRLNKYVKVTQEQMTIFIERINLEQKHMIERAEQYEVAFYREYASINEHLAGAQAAMIAQGHALLESANQANHQFLQAISEQQQGLFSQAAAQLEKYQQQSEDMKQLIQSEQRLLSDQLAQKDSEIKALRGITTKFEHSVATLSEVPAVLADQLQVVSLAAQQFSASTQQIEKTHERLADNLQSLEGTLMSVEMITNRLSKDLTDASSRLGTQADQQTIILNRLAGAFETLQALMRQTQSIENNLTKAIEIQKQVSIEWMTGMQQNTESMMGLGAGMAQQQQSADQLQTMLEKFFGTIQRSSDSVNSLEGQLLSLEQMLSSNTAANESNVSAIQGSWKTIESITGQLESITALLKPILSEVSTLQQISENLGKLSEQLKAPDANENPSKDEEILSQINSLASTISELHLAVKQNHNGNGNGSH